MGENVSDDDVHSGHPTSSPFYYYSLVFYSLEYDIVSHVMSKRAKGDMNETR